MKIQIKRFGEFLTSRPEGREAALLVLANELRERSSALEIDFEGVLVMTPSWLSEFRNTLLEKGVKGIAFLPSSNGSVQESIRFVELENSLGS